jgi:hypothetical protein
VKNEKKKDEEIITQNPMDCGHKDERNIWQVMAQLDSF